MPTVASVTPANGAAGVQNDLSVQVELTRLDSTDVTKVETTAADFAAGTLVNAQARATNDLALFAGPAVSDDFNRANGAPGGNWTIVGGTWAILSNTLNCSAGTGDLYCLNTYLSDTDGEVLVESMAGPNSGQRTGVVIRCSADGKYMYALSLERENNRWGLWKCVNGTWTQLGGWISLTTAYTDLRWYRLNASGTTIKAKVWIDGTSEPSSWGLTVTDSAIASGYPGLHAWQTLPQAYDNFSYWSVAHPGVYPTSGSRVSPAYPLSAAGVFGTGFVQYDATVPTNTTLTLKISKDGTTWTTVASGDRIVLWSEGDSLASADIYTQALLTTSDTSITPVLAEVRLVFLPMDSSLVEIDVDGVAFTLANGGLSMWNTAKVTTGPVISQSNQDLFFGTFGQWFAYGGKVVTVLVKYAGATISTTSFITEQLVSWWGSKLYASWMPQAIGGAYDGPMRSDAWYFVSHLEDYLVRGDSHYYVQFPPTVTSDAWYWVAHAVRFDTPLSAIVGQPVTHDVPASGVGNCWARCDTPASGITQSWMRGDHAASGIVAVPVPAHDEPLAGIVGLPLATEQPASGVVYEVNANNAIDLRVISVEEAAFLAALGISFQ